MQNKLPGLDSLQRISKEAGRRRKQKGRERERSEGR